MKTLAQIEPRTIITSLPYTIIQSGSYSVSGNLTGVGGQEGITVNAAHVTLDLGGFTLTGGGGKDGIVLSATATNVTIRNGTLTKWSQSGINAHEYSAVGTRVVDVRCIANNAAGIAVGLNGVVQDCHAENNGQWGILTRSYSEVANCQSIGNKTVGMQIDGVCIVRECLVSNNLGSGIAGAGECQVIGCTVRGNGGDGINLDGGSVVRNCNSTYNNIDGIEVTRKCIVADNQCAVNGLFGDGAGIHVTDSGNRVESNHVIGGNRGLDIDGIGNFVAENTVKDNTVNYDIATGNQLNLLLGQLPQTISWPASVKLAGSLSVSAGDAITIAADEVTLDLDGHTIFSTAASASGTAILLSGERRNIAIRNGHIKGGVTYNGGVYSGSGFGSGISFTVTQPHNVRVSSLSVSGCLMNGIAIGNSSTVVESCTVDTAGLSGIMARTITRCTARMCGSTGILAIAGVASDCYGEATGAGTGVSAVMAQNCTGYSSSGTGIGVNVAQNCNGSSSSGVGLEAGKVANTCSGSSVSGTGLTAFIANSCVGNGSPALNVTHKYNMP